MADLLEMLRRVESELRRCPAGAEHCGSAAMWREYLMLRDRAMLGGGDDPVLAGAVAALAARAAGYRDANYPDAVYPDAVRREPEPRAAQAPVAGLVAAVGRAVLAPSLHNSQPWRFVVDGGNVEVWLDPRRGLPAADPGFRAARMACGAAVFNLRLAVPVELGRQVDTAVLPEYGHRDLIARLRVGPARPATPRERTLYAAIGRRHTNRYPFRDDVAVDSAEQTALRAAAYSEGCWLDVMTDPAQRDELAGLSRRAERLLAADPAYRQELRAWVRGEATGELLDGVPARAAGPRPEPRDPLGQRDYGGTDRRVGQEYEREPLLAVLGGPGDTPASQVAAGQALQRVLLTATSHGLAVSLYSQPFDIGDLRARVRALIGRLGAPYLLLRIGYPTRPAPATPRRAVSEITQILGGTTGRNAACSLRSRCGRYRPR